MRKLVLKYLALGLMLSANEAAAAKRSSTTRGETVSVSALLSNWTIGSSGIRFTASLAGPLGTSN